MSRLVMSLSIGWAVNQIARREIIMDQSVMLSKNFTNFF